MCSGTALLVPLLTLIVGVRGASLSWTSGWHRTTIDPLTSHFELIEQDFSGVIVLEAEVEFKYPAMSTGCFEYELALFIACATEANSTHSAAMTYHEVPLMNGTCDGGKCRQAVVYNPYSCAGKAQYYAYLSNNNTVCVWNDHYVSLYYECQHSHYGDSCLLCDNCAACGCHGDAMLADNVCSCTCKNHWSGDSCEKCPEPYSGHDCNKCLPGYIADGTDCRKCDPDPSCQGVMVPSSDQTKCECGEPECTGNTIKVDSGCRGCTIATDCNGHATSVMADASTNKCICVCSGLWSGDDCSACPPQYDQNTCNTCASGRIIFPLCVLCTNAGFCSNHATNAGVNGLIPSNPERTECMCECMNAFTGPGCSVCPRNYDGEYCDRCSTEFAHYPKCTRCTVTEHCNGRATEVVRDPTYATCNCTCQNAWTGPHCDTCPPNYEGENCDRCAEGYYDYEKGCLKCTMTDHCVHATNVTSKPDRSGCQCTCENQFTGDRCDVCPDRYVETVWGCPECSGCKECAEYHYDYPRCGRCGLEEHCKGRASSVDEMVDGNTVNCKCACNNQWTGDLCETCPANFRQDDCAWCAEGYINYPSCTQCTSEVHCSNHATSVTSKDNNTACVCTCRNAWSGADCSVCPEGTGGTDCDRCVGNYIGYPTCVICTNEGACNGRAVSVTSNADNTKCTCTCKDQWAGTRCETCPQQYDMASGCNKCSPGHINYPDCTACTNDKHCKGNAKIVATNAAQTQCTCTCKNQYTLSDCSYCPPSYAGDCNECRSGTVGYPNCRPCSTNMDCTDPVRASAVAYDSSTKGCKCTCNNQWSGNNCGTCDPIYDQQNCDSCAAGHINYPSCTKCTIAAHCNPIGTVDVTSNSARTACECKCTKPWTGPKCEQCPAPYTGERCDKCMKDYLASTSNNELHCELCTSNKHCNSHAASVTADEPQKTCVCKCRNQWTGDTCGTCPSPYDGENHDCDKCLDGYINYPVCTKCDVSTHCGGVVRSSGATSNAEHTACKCTCKDAWQGDSCELCPSNFNSDGCNRCSFGHFEYPKCYACSTERHCNNHAVSTRAVSDGMDGWRCECTCKHQWQGDTCNQCEPRFSATCDGCAAGYVEYPSCRTCTVEVDCAGRASTVTSNGKVCECTCKGGWTGKRCETCPLQYQQDGTCSKCQPNRINFPDCTLCEAKQCGGSNGQAAFPNKDQTACECKCKNQWDPASKCTVCPDPYGGTECNQCKSGYIQVGSSPLRCEKCEIAVHCSGHADTVTAQGTQCVCQCTKPWDGTSCNRCDQVRYDSTCTKCASGYVGYPDCKACTAAALCNDGGTVVTTEMGECKCACSTSRTGTNCEMCAEGYFGYPNCVRCPNTCVNGNSTVKADNTGCECKCDGYWTGEQCDTCPTKYEQSGCKACADGHVNFPECTKCSNETHCSGHAKEVYSSGGKCHCTCLASWSGLRCETCPAAFDASSGCAQCAEGHHGYPICGKCTNADHCNGRADSVTHTGDFTDCECTCRNHWRNAQGTTRGCEVCPEQYDGADCNECAEGYFGPLCEKCSIAKHCSNHAWNVTSDSMRTKCECNCTGAWTGDDCAQCPSNYDAASGCTQCAAGHHGPGCKECTREQHCNGRGTAKPSADKSECVCECDGNFGGPTCEECVPPYTGDNCGECSADTFLKPDGKCEQCTSEMHCNGRATAVAPNEMRDGCACTCRPMYTGSDCSACAAGYIKASGGATGCVRCTDVDHCSSHSTSVTSNDNRDKCVCTCRGKWEGETCNVCPEKYTGDDCDRCRVGVGPDCTGCSVEAHCSGHASSVTPSQDMSSCNCVCEENWSGAPDCGTCTEGYFGASCAKCTNDAHCNGRAKNPTIASSPDRTGCDCGECIGKWTGTSCEQCDPKYNQQTCAECAEGLVGPDCVECSVGSHCTSGAANATVKGGSCVCECRNHWSGARCDVCPEGYTGMDCDSCKDGYIMFDGACTKCTVEAHCNGNANGVSVSEGKCVCQCSGKWSGETCNVCSPPFAGSGCNECAEGFINYPTCEACTAETHCAGHGQVVRSNPDRTKCICECYNKWSPSESSPAHPACSSCSSPYTGAECSQCVPDHANYPVCERCTVEKHCNGRAVKVSVERGECSCQCTNHWQGADCGVCPLPYGGSSCDKCRVGYYNYPECIKCSTEQHCRGRATSATSNADQTGCVCQCNRPWQGDACDTCAMDRFTAKCDSCKDGHVNYPDCTPCDASACNGRAHTVASNADHTKCICNCDNGWTGDSCETCPPKYTGVLCNQCATGHVGYPECEPCKISTHCQGNGDSVHSNPDNTKCVCTCKPEYTGETCGECNLGFSRDSATGKCVRDRHAWCVGNPTQVPHGKPPACDAATEIDGTCDLECTNGYTPSAKYVCKQEGWTVPSCDDAPCTTQPNPVEGGAAPGCTLPTPSGEMCPGQCKSGYTAQGDYLCNKGAWFPSLTCTPQECTTQPDPIQHGSADCTLPAQHGATCSYTCEAGYRPSRPLSCSAGTWTTVTCDPVECQQQPPTVPNGGPHSCTTPTPSGQSCRLKCNTAGRPPQCSPTPELDMADNFITADGGPGVGYVCFEWIPQQATRENAASVCKAKGGWLASIHNMAIETVLWEHAVERRWWSGLQVMQDDNPSKQAFQRAVTHIPNIDKTCPTCTQTYARDTCPESTFARFNEDAAYRSKGCDHIMRDKRSPSPPKKCECIELAKAKAETCGPDEGSLTFAEYNAVYCEDNGASTTNAEMPRWGVFDAKTDASWWNQHYTDPLLTEGGCCPGMDTASSPGECMLFNVGHIPDCPYESNNCTLALPFWCMYWDSGDEGSRREIFDATANYTCTAGKWTSGKCVPKKCTTPPPTITTGDNDACSLPKLHGETCPVKCHDGHEKQNDHVCEYGTWRVAYCPGKSCKEQPPKVEHGLPPSCHLPAADKMRCTLRCEDGYTFSDSYKCTKGTWEVPQCIPNQCYSQPSPVENGYPDHVNVPAPAGTTVKVLCVEGYTASGSYQCVRGGWSEPACNPSACEEDPPATPPNSCSKGAPHGTECSVTCPGGFYPSGNGGVVSCRYGKWHSPTCVPKPCDNPPSVPNAYPPDCPANPVPSGMKCTVTCYAGYVSSGDHTCLNGNWASTAQCTPASCTSPPPTLEGGTTAPCTLPAKSGSTCSAAGSCLPGRTPSGDYKCHAGQWSAPTCQKAPCSGPPPRGELDAPPPECDAGTSTPSGESCPATCRGKPSGDWTCDDGTWSAPDCSSKPWMTARCKHTGAIVGSGMLCTVKVGGYDLPSASDVSNALSFTSTAQVENVGVAQVKDVVEVTVRMTSSLTGKHDVTVSYVEKGLSAIFSVTFTQLVMDASWYDASGKLMGQHRYSVDPSRTAVGVDPTYSTFAIKPSFDPLIDDDTLSGTWSVSNPDGTVPHFSPSQTRNTLEFAIEDAFTKDKVIAYVARLTFSPSFWEKPYEAKILLEKASTNQPDSLILEPCTIYIGEQTSLSVTYPSKFALDPPYTYTYLLARDHAYAMSFGSTLESVKQFDAVQATAADEVPLDQHTAKCQWSKANPSGSTTSNPFAATRRHAQTLAAKPREVKIALQLFTNQLKVLGRATVRANVLPPRKSRSQILMELSTAVKPTRLGLITTCLAFEGTPEDVSAVEAACKSAMPKLLAGLDRTPSGYPAVYMTLLHDAILRYELLPSHCSELCGIMEGVTDFSNWLIIYPVNIDSTYNKMLRLSEWHSSPCQCNGNNNMLRRGFSTLQQANSSFSTILTQGEPGLLQITRIHDLVSQAVSRARPGSETATKLYQSPSGLIDALSTHDVHSTFRGGRVVGVDKCKVVFQGRHLPFGTVGSLEAYTVTVMATWRELAPNVPSAEHLGSYLYTFQAKGSQGLVERLTKRVVMTVKLGEGESPPGENEGLRLLRDGKWVLPAGCHAVDAPEGHVAIECDHLGTWAIRRSRKVDLPPPPSPRTPQPSYAPSSAVPHIPSPPRTAPPGLESTSEHGEGAPMWLLVAGIVVIVILFATLCTLSFCYWRKGLQASTLSSKVEQAMHKAAGTNMEYGDLPVTPTDPRMSACSEMDEVHS